MAAMLAGGRHTHCPNFTIEAARMATPGFRDCCATIAAAVLTLQRSGANNDDIIRALQAAARCEAVEAKQLQQTE